MIDKRNHLNQNDISSKKSKDLSGKESRKKVGIEYEISQNGI